MQNKQSLAGGETEHVLKHSGAVLIIIANKRRKTSDPYGASLGSILDTNARESTMCDASSTMIMRANHKL